MKSSYSNKIVGALFGLCLLLGVGFVSSTTAQAQYGTPQYKNDQWRREQARRDRDNRRDQRRRDRDRGYGNNGNYGNNGYGRYNDGYGDYGGSFQLRQTALNEGFNEGLKAGRKDRSRGEYSNYSDEGEFQKGTKSYNSRLGDRETYRRYFREAFSHGYADGYSGY